MPDVRGIGLDLCGIDRMAPYVDNERFLTRYFNASEIAYIHSRGQSAAQTLAGLFAAKEAVSKALGTGIAFALTDVSIDHTPDGQPVAVLSGKAAELACGGSFLLTITHDAGVAAAMVVWQV